MWQQEFTWFFALFHHEFRKGNLLAFEVLMALAFAHFLTQGQPSLLPLGKRRRLWRGACRIPGEAGREALSSSREQVYFSLRGTHCQDPYL